LLWFPVVTDKGEGAYESDGAPSDERGDGDADDEGDDLLDDETDDLEADEGKADEEAPPQEGDEEASAPKAEVKKPAEPFVVPTAGPFYMHDDRFGGEDAKRWGDLCLGWGFLRNMQRSMKVSVFILFQMVPGCL
jgi:hypothetical protein